MKTITFLLIFFLTVQAVSAVNVECFDDGSIKITDLEETLPVSAKKESSLSDYSEVPGLYFYSQQEKKFNFDSDGALFVSPAEEKYNFKIGSYTETVVCPPFKFSCLTFNLSIDYCYTHGGLFTSRFSVGNFYFDPLNALRFAQPLMLRYEVLTEDNRPLIHSPNHLSDEFKDINITLTEFNAGNRYLLKWPTELNIKKFAVRYDQCRQKRYNFFTAAECTHEIDEFWSFVKKNKKMLPRNFSQTLKKAMRTRT